MPKYYVHMTVNSPRGEYELIVETSDLNVAMAEALRARPSTTSVVMSIVPNIDGVGVTFDQTGVATT